MQGEVVRDELANHKIDTFLGATKNRLKREVRQELSVQARDIDELVLNNLLDSSTDEILLKAMSLNFNQKNLSLTALIAKDELMRMLSIRDKNDKPDPLLIACAEKVSKMLLDLKVSLYGKEASIVDNANAECDITKLSTNELIKMLENERK
ncbi:hypothetical protein BKN38_04780 [Helicobacter sp. CLO-3]|nr:hypothetical protein BA723_06370 [Helicobacter sp. CLO-3]OHU83932.1 hypothetical protein BKN38_04780 [Helicobacter sp. CLO-3]